MSKFIKVKEELEKAYESLKTVRKGVNLFGSARLKPGTYYYNFAEKVAYELAKKNFTIISGGGPAIMEAANKGATRAGKYNIGLNIQLPYEQKPNKYIHKNGLINFKYFYTRKVMFTISSLATVVFPGGYGTMDEMFEQLTLLQTKKIKPRPVVLVDNKYYKHLILFLHEMVRTGTIEKTDIKLFQIADTPEEVIKKIVDGYESQRKKRYI